MKLRRNEKWWLGVVAALTYGSGVLLWWVATRWRCPGLFGEQHHPTEHTLRALHTSLSLTALLGLGYMIKGHILPGWRAKRSLVSGSTLCTMLAVVALSALALLYGSDDATLTAAQFAHTWVGIGAVLPLAWHVVARPKRL